MNYITQLNGFFEYLDREISLTPNCVSLYVALLHINNKRDWEKEFTVKNIYIEKLIGMHRVKLDEARNKLKQAGLINYEKAAGSAAGIYSIAKLGRGGEILTGTQTGTQSVTQTGTQTGTQIENYPINNNKLKPKPKQREAAHSPFLPPTEREVYEYCLDKNYKFVVPAVFIGYYESVGWTVGKRKMKSWRGAADGWEHRERAKREIPHKPEQKSFSELISDAEKGGDI